MAFVALHSCNRADVKGMSVPVSDGVDKRFEQSSAMNEGLKSGVVEAQEEYMFYVATDPHIHKTHKNLGIFNDEFRFPAYLKALSFNSERHTFDHDLFHILGKQKVSLVLQGHDHYREDLTYDNVRYTVLGAINEHMDNPEYLKDYVNQDYIDFDWRTIPSR